MGMLEGLGRLHRQTGRLAWQKRVIEPVLPRPPCAANRSRRLSRASRFELAEHLREVQRPSMSCMA